MLNYELIGKRIKEYRKINHITQEMLAEWTGLTAPHISRIENNQKKVSLEAIAAIAKVFQVPVDALLYGDIYKDHEKSSIRTEILLGCTDDDLMFFYDILCVLQARLKEYIYNK